MSAGQSDQAYLRARDSAQGKRLTKDIKPDPRTCSSCGKSEADKTCTLCKSVIYCSAECQKAHWTTGGHKRACKNFELPPRKAVLEDGFEEDLIWYKGHDKEDGIGFWATERVAQVGLHCDHPYDLPDERYHVKHIQQAPHGWKRVAGPPHDPSLYATSLLCLNVLVQNRSQKSVLRPSGYAIYGVVSDAIVDVLTPEEKKEVAPVVDNLHTLGPWKDYDGKRRFQIRSINGVELSRAAKTPRAEAKGHLNQEWPFEDPPQPTESPFDKVADWTRGFVNLFPGDYVVYSVQFHVAKGNDLLSLRPAALGNMPALGMIYITDQQAKERVAQGVSSDPGHPRRQLLPRITGELQRHNLLKHYKTFFEKGPDAYGRERFGEARWAARSIK